MKPISQLEYYTLLGDETVRIQVGADDIVYVNGRESQVYITWNENGESIISYNGEVHQGEVLRLHQNECTVSVNGNTYSFSIETELGCVRRHLLPVVKEKAICQINAPLPGEIVAVLVAVGQEVRKGEALMILEAMKMQNEIVSPVAGKICSMRMKEGDSILKDQLLIEIEPA